MKKQLFNSINGVVTEGLEIFNNNEDMASLYHILRFLTDEKEIYNYLRMLYKTTEEYYPEEDEILCMIHNLKLYLEEDFQVR